MKNRKLYTRASFLLFSLFLIAGMSQLALYYLCERYEDWKIASKERYLEKKIASLLGPSEIERLRPLALSGDTNACNKLFMHYSVFGDVSNEVIFLTIVAEKGDPKAAFDLGETYSKDWRVRDEKKAYYWYKKAADAGDQRARYHLKKLTK